MQQLFNWFQADPRRICVVGVWAYLLGCAATFHALVAGAPVGPLVAGIALTLAGGALKIAGRDRFKLHRLRRHRAGDAPALQPEVAS